MDLKKLLPLLLTCTPLFASHDFHSQQIEGLVGVSHASHSPSGLHLGSGSTTERDTLHSNSSNNDVTWGVAYAYNILPFFTAYQHHNPDSVLQHVLLGLDWMFMDTTDSGEVYQYGLRSLNDFDYDLDVRTSRIMLNSEIDFKSPWKKVFPFLQLSAGGARLTTHYHDHPDASSVGGVVKINDYTNYNLAYTLGAGFKVLFTPHFQGSLSYQYTDFGVIKTDENTLSDRFYTSSGLLGLTYLFD